MIDDGDPDDKIIAIPFFDPMYNSYNDISDLPQHTFQEMSHFFAVYKALEAKPTAIDKVRNRAEAVKIIKASMARYDEKFGVL